MSTIAYNSINEIPQRKYEGYIWFSDQNEPQVLHNEIFDFNTVATNPFIIEAILYAEGKSIHILHDGTYKIFEHDLEAYKNGGAILEDKEYLPHRLGEKVNTVCFKQIWMEEADALCEDYPVLKLKATVFCGFNK